VLARQKSSKIRAAIVSNCGSQQNVEQGMAKMDFISHCTKKKQQQFGNKAMLSMLCVLAAFGLLGWIYLAQASHVTMTSRRVQELEAEKARLQDQSMQLMAEIADLESVERLAARSEALGFVSIPVDDAEFLVIAEPTDADILLASTSPTGSWWNRITDQFIVWSRAELQ
jgi:cell division protein FtsB